MKTPYIIKATSEGLSVTVNGSPIPWSKAREFVQNARKAMTEGVAIMCREGKHYDEIGTAIGISSELAYQWARSWNVKAPRKPRVRVKPYLISGDVEAKAMTLYKSGASDAAIARTLGRAQATVSSWRCRVGLPRHYCRNVRTFDYEEAGRLYDGGMTLEEVGNKFGVTREAVRIALRTIGKKSRAQSEWRSKARPLDCEAAFAMIEGGTSIADAAKKCGFSTVTFTSRMGRHDRARWQRALAGLRLRKAEKRTKPRYVKMLKYVMAGHTYRETAKKFGVSNILVNHVCSGWIGGRLTGIAYEAKGIHAPRESLRDGLLRKKREGKLGPQAKEWMT